MGPAGLAMPGDDLSIPENYAYVCLCACVLVAYLRARAKAQRTQSRLALRVAPFVSYGNGLNGHFQTAYIIFFYNCCIL